LAGGDNLLDDAMQQLKGRNPESYYKIDPTINAASDEHQLYSDSVFSIEPLVCFFI